MSSTLGTRTSPSTRSRSLQSPTLKSMTSGGERSYMEKDVAVLDGTLEDYEEMLDWSHQGILGFLREELRKVPLDGEGGQKHGDLLKGLIEERAAVEEQLEATSKLIQGKAQLRALEVLQTRTVPLSEVNANLEEWVDAIKAEYDSLTKVTGAIIPIHKDSLKGRTDVEFAPGKLVATIKPLGQTSGDNGGKQHGRKKARLVVCGNRVEPSGDQQLKMSEENQEESFSEYRNKGKKYDTYAGGVDGTSVRAVLRKAGGMKWSCAGIDVKTAFLLAPRRGEGLLVVKPPKILVQAGIVKETEWWQVSRALYGLQSSPNDWGQFRDKQLRGWTWSDETKDYMLQSTSEPNLWKILGRGRELGSEKIGLKTKLSWNCEGYMVVYVDDLLVVGEDPVIKATLKKVQDTWTCSTPEWADEKPMKFCGFEIRKTAEGLEVGQQSYTAELLQRHGITRTRPTPASNTPVPEEPEEYSKEELKVAQGLTGELLWLAIRTRPDIAFVTSLMGRLATKNPRFTAKLGREVLEYLAGTKEVSLRYGPVEKGDFGPEACLAFARDMRRVEVFADVSFAPQASKSVQGIIAMLLSYVEAMSVADSVGCIISILEDVPI